ncbi:MAG: acyl-CoA thioesterase II [Longimonas sp.]|uniref:acyl-CoA thioesterase II n=1 Tax=Longimonas sp. TaxID=2039626 RepID=UPI00397705A3
MAYTLSDLRALIDLERIEDTIFRGTSYDIGSGSVFGGQALAQSLVAAHRTLDTSGRVAHSMHGYFILPGDVEAPIVYEVDRLRDGSSFTTRRIIAIQHGRAIFNMAASFHAPEPGDTHQTSMPDVPAPSALSSDIALLREIKDRIPEHLHPLYTEERPIEVRRVDPVNPFAPEPSDPVNHMWMRARGTLPHEPLLHQAVFAYMSDYGLLSTALRPHGRSFLDPALQLASLDHAMWFHRPFSMNEWLLYSAESPAAHGARGFVRGQLFTQDGTLVASVAQEGLMRMHDHDNRDDDQSA